MNSENQKSLLGLKIRNFRKQKGYTQEKLSEILNIDISGLSKIENGKSFPSVETACKLMETLKIPPEELFDFINCKTRKSLKDEIFLEKMKQLSSKDKEKILKFIEILKD